MSSYRVYEGYINEYLDKASQHLNESSLMNGPHKTVNVNIAEEFLNKAASGLADLQNMMVIVPTNEKQYISKQIASMTNRYKEIQGQIGETKNRQILVGNRSKNEGEIASTENINQTIASLQESEQIGKGILSSLGSQKEKLLSTHNNLHGIEISVDDSTEVVNRMGKTQNCNMIVMWSVVALLVLAILLVIVLSF